MGTNPRQFPGNSVRGKNEIHAAGSNGTLRHAIEFGRFFILGEGNPPLSLDRCNPQGTVRSSSGKNYPNRIASLVLRE